eukprot:4740776-Amphidinium_carterae.1
MHLITIASATPDWMVYLAAEKKNHSKCGGALNHCTQSLKATLRDKAHLVSLGRYRIICVDMLHKKTYKTTRMATERRKVSLNLV